MTTVNILGTEYKVIREPFKDKDIDGYCDYTSREIRIRDDNVNEVGDFDELMRKQLRHEIIHAFLAESGLQANFEHYKQFGHEETIIDWIAIQFPKMIKAFESVNALQENVRWVPVTFEDMANPGKIITVTMYPGDRSGQPLFVNALTHMVEQDQVLKFNLIDAGWE